MFVGLTGFPGAVHSLHVAPLAVTATVPLYVSPAPAPVPKTQSTSGASGGSGGVEGGDDGLAATQTICGAHAWRVDVVHAEIAARVRAQAADAQLGARACVRARARGGRRRFEAWHGMRKHRETACACTACGRRAARLACQSSRSLEVAQRGLLEEPEPAIVPPEGVEACAIADAC